MTIHGTRDEATARPERSRRGPYAKGVQRRQEILDRAIEVFTERGMEGTSLRTIAEAIGVSHAALLHYFPSREALLVEVVRQREEQRSLTDERRDNLFAELAEIAEKHTDTPGLVSLHTMLLAASIQTGDVEANEFFTERFRRARHDVGQRLLAQYGPEVVGTEAEAERVAALILAAFDGLQVQWLLDPSVDLPGALRLLERLLR